MLGKDQPVILQLLEVPQNGRCAQGRGDGTGRLRIPAAGKAWLAQMTQWLPSRM
jgi:hypothetical protein